MCALMTCKDEVDGDRRRARVAELVGAVEHKVADNAEVGAAFEHVCQQNPRRGEADGSPVERVLGGRCAQLSHHGQGPGHSSGALATLLCRYFT